MQKLALGGMNCRSAILRPTISVQKRLVARALWFFLSISILSSCRADSNESASLKSTDDNKNIFIRGEITPKLRDDFLQLIDDRTQTVTIDSEGGDERSALELGRAILHRKLKVIVSNLCSSACAHYIFLVARQRDVLPNSLVFFHHTSASFLAMSGFDESEPLKVMMDKHNKAAEQLYRDAGVDTRMLLMPQLEIQTRCYFYVLDRKGSGKIADIRYVPAYFLWIPYKSLLESAGATVSGFWPRSFEEFTSAGQAQKDRASVGNKPILFGGPGILPSSEEIAKRYASISRCEAKPNT